MRGWRWDDTDTKKQTGHPVVFEFTAFLLWLGQIIEGCIFFYRLCSTKRRPKISFRKYTEYRRQRCVSTRTHQALSSRLRAACYQWDSYVVKSWGGWGVEVNQIRFVTCCHCSRVALKGFVGLVSKLSKPTKWVAWCREELLWSTRQDALYSSTFFTHHHAA